MTGQAQDESPVQASRARLRRAAAQRRQRVRAAERTEPADWQEAHAPTERVILRDDGGRRVGSARRRKVDARLWESFTPDQERAARRIQETAARITAGTEARIGRYDGMPAGGTPGVPGDDPDAEQLRALKDRYTAWVRACRDEGVSHAAVLDVLLFGQSCRATDRARRKRKGWAKANLMAGLDLYCRLAGRGG